MLTVCLAFFSSKFLSLECFGTKRKLPLSCLSDWTFHKLLITFNNGLRSVFQPALMYHNILYHMSAVTSRCKHVCNCPCRQKAVTELFPVFAIRVIHTNWFIFINNQMTDSLTCWSLRGPTCRLAAVRPQLCFITRGTGRAGRGRGCLSCDQTVTPTSSRANNELRVLGHFTGCGISSVLLHKHNVWSLWSTVDTQ